MAEGLRISCDDCVMRDTDACGDCVVTFICGRDPDDAVIIDAAEARAVRMLARGGLVPELRHTPSEGEPPGAPDASDASEGSPPGGATITELPGASGVAGA